VRTEEAGQSGLNDGRSVDAADDWVADDWAGEVNSLDSNANAFATVNFPPADVSKDPASHDTASHDTASYDSAPYDTAGSHVARVASTIEPALATHMTRARIRRVAQRDRNSFRAAFRGPLGRAGGSGEGSVQRATQKSWAVFVPGCSHNQSRHRFS
jgi:hypothetical protein